jgi:hypothetical protein
LVPVSRAGATATSTGATFISQPGDYIGQGATYSLPTVTVSDGGGYPTFQVSNGADSFQVSFAAPAGQSLATGEYENAQQTPVRSAGSPGLDVSGDGRSCNQLSGHFTVYDVTYDGGGNVLSFAAQFVQNCDGFTGDLAGSISYQSSVTMPSWLVSSTTDDFGSMRIGDASKPQDTTLTNFGGPAVVTGFTFEGLAVNDFVGQTDCETTLAPGQSCTLSMTFLPSELGIRQASVSAVDGQNPSPAISLSGTGTAGYYIADSEGNLGFFGDAAFWGTEHLAAPIVSLAATPSGDGYTVVASDGAVLTYGNAYWLGSLAGLTLNKPIVGIAAKRRDTNGYWLVAGDGGIFTFGDARFYGSMGGKPLNRPIVGMATTPDGVGYWLVASDGGIFSFGDAQFYGSMGGTSLNQPVVGMASTPDGGGYWLVASDGGIFSFGDAQFYGSMGGTPLNQPVVGMTPTWDGGGYWFVASDGGVFSFGDAPFFGSSVGSGIQDVIGIAGTAPPTLQATLGIHAARARSGVLPQAKPGWRAVQASP